MEQRNEDQDAIDQQLAQLDIRPDEEEGAQNVRVMVRCRPALPGELASLQLDQEQRQVSVQGRHFQFDAVFGPQVSDEQVYMRSARRLVESAFRGFHCTCFLYGQTGTGKTHTQAGLASNAFAHLFSLIRDSDPLKRFLIRASYYELYNENIRDLLSDSPKALELRESKARGVYVKDLTCYLVNNAGELERLKRLGDRRRATAATRMNEHSSRSHSILSLAIEMVRPAGAASGPVRLGRLHLVDLAGSERQVKSGSSGARLKEASQINLSLTCLSLVIRALTGPKLAHVPYRNSKLTRLLSSSLGGNSKTLLIACVSPASSSLDETLNTLRFASRTKLIKNEPKINEDAKDALLRKYRQQVGELRRQLEQKASNAASLADDDQIEALIAAAHQHGQQVASGPNHQLLKQLKLLRAKIMVGGENLLERAEIHGRLLEASRQELEEKRRREAALQLELEQRRSKLSQMAQVKGSLEGQLAELDAKLQRALLLYKTTKEEARDQESEQRQLRDHLLHSIRSTSREINYADCIIDDFIPKEYLELINAYAQYDDESDEWQIKCIALTGNNIAQTRRLTLGQPDQPPAELPGQARPGNSASGAARPDPYVRASGVRPPEAVCSLAGKAAAMRSANK